MMIDGGVDEGVGEQQKGTIIQEGAMMEMGEADRPTAAKDWHRTPHTANLNS
jgi:hypothetical protein